MAQEISKDYTLRSPKPKRFSRTVIFFEDINMILKIKVVPITDSKQKRRIFRAESNNEESNSHDNESEYFNICSTSNKRKYGSKKLISIVERQIDKLSIFSRESTIKRKSGSLGHSVYAYPDMCIL